MNMLFVIEYNEVAWTQVLWYWDRGSDNPPAPRRWADGERLHRGDAGQRDGSWPGQGGRNRRLRHFTPNNMQFNTYELFPSGTFYLILADPGWPRVTETVESETTDEGGRL